MSRFGIALAIGLAMAGPAFAQAPKSPCGTNPAPVTVYFEWAKAQLTESNSAIISQAVSRMTADHCAIAVVLVEGHTDASTESDPAQAVDAQRADVVAQALADAGLAPDRIAPGVIEKRSRGKTMPVRATADGVREPLNRRAVVTIVFAEGVAGLAAKADAIRGKITKGAEVVKLLGEADRCGAPAPKGYACALLVYKTTARNGEAIKDSEGLKPLPRLVTGITGEGDAARATTLHPTLFCPSETRPPGLVEFILTVDIGGKTTDYREELVAVIGRAENEKLDPKSVSKVDPALFKAGNCTRPTRVAAAPPKPAPPSDPGWGAPAEQVMAAFGLIGDFSDTCDTPLGGPNHSTFTPAGDGVVIGKSAMAEGAGLTGDRVIQTLFSRGQLTGKDELKLRGTLDLTGQEVEVTVRKSDKGLRIINVTTLQGVKIVANSKTVLPAGHTYPWMKRCG